MSDFFVAEWVIVELTHLHHAVKVHVEQFKDHVQCVLVSDNFHAGDDVWVLEPDHGLDLGVSHCRLPRSELPFEGLQRIYLLRFFIGDLVNDSEATFAKGFQHTESLN